MRHHRFVAAFVATCAVSSLTTFAARAESLPAAPGVRHAPVAAPSAPAEKSGLVPTIKPRVDLVFALDTTGSMGGLIDGAKRKIWAIANEVASAQQKPEVRIGLVAYRDRGDAYVTQVVPLTDDLDAVYTKLMSFTADGGGDGPEDVNSALHDAVTKMAWSADKKALKMVFLVGDAPPHMDYDQQVRWQTTAQLALKQNIYINTVQCGADVATTTTWREIAHAAEGRFAAIPQDGGVRVAEATPYDAELVRLGAELDATNFTYGRVAERMEQVASRKKAEGYAAAAPVAAAADRAVAKNKLNTGMKATDDLITLADSVGGAESALARVKSDELPDELRGKDKAQQKAIVEANQKKRAQVQQQIAELSKKRDQHLADAAKKTPAATDAFDGEVKGMVRAEGEALGLTW
jgi:hypothetical protein